MSAINIRLALEAWADNGNLNRDHIPEIAREIAAISTLPIAVEEKVKALDVPVKDIETCLLNMSVTTPEMADIKKGVRLWLANLSSPGKDGGQELPELTPELSGSMQWAMAEAFETSEATTTSEKMVSVYEAVRATLRSGKDGGQEVEAVELIPATITSRDGTVRKAFVDTTNGRVLEVQPASTALVERLTSALQSARHYVVDAIEDDGGIDSCDIIDRSTLEKIDTALASAQSTSREGER